MAESVTVHVPTREYLSAVHFVADQITYGAASRLKEMLESEIRALSLSSRPTMRLNDATKKRKRLLLLPTYMIAAACDTIAVALSDRSDAVEVFKVAVSGAEAVIEKHADRHVVIGRVGDVRVSSLEALEDSLVWVHKPSPRNFVQLRSEWRALRVGDVPIHVRDMPKAYFLGEVSGLRINADVRSVYNMSDYLVEVLGETSTCLPLSMHAHRRSDCRREVATLALLASHASLYGDPYGDGVALGGQSVLALAAGAQAYGNLPWSRRSPRQSSLSSMRTCGRSSLPTCPSAIYASLWATSTRAWNPSCSRRSPFYRTRWRQRCVK